MKIGIHVLLSACTFTLCSTSNVIAASEAIHHVDIPRQRVSAALNTLAAQTGLQVIVNIEDTLPNEVIAPSVTGDLTVDEVMRRLLVDSGLKWSYVNKRTVTVVRAGESGTAGQLRMMTSAVDAPASLLQGEGRGDLHGVPVVHEETDRRPAELIAATEEKKAVEQITIVGSRLSYSPGDTGPSPVIVIDRNRIDQLGATSVSGLLSYVPQQALSLVEGMATFAGSNRVQLRGLGLGTTLVLLNGRRTVTSAIQGGANVFDLNSVPVSAIERVEVLSDSASAIYGADAIGGVVNIVLRKEMAHPSLEMYYGAADSGADERRASISASGTVDRLSGFVSVDFLNRGYLHGAERSLYADQDYRRFGGTDLRVDYAARLGNICSASGENLPGLEAPCASVPSGSSGVGLTPSAFEATAGQTNVDSYYKYSSVVPAATRKSLIGTGELELGSSKVFGEYLFVDRSDESVSAPATLFSDFVPTTNPFNPFGVPVLATGLIGGLPSRVDEAESKMHRGVIGVSGAIQSWEWGVSLLGVRDKGSRIVGGSVDGAALADALSSTDPSIALNPFRDGTAGAPGLLALLTASPPRSQYQSEALQGSADIHGSALRLPAGKIQFALGGEWREEKLLYNADGTAFDSSRHSAAGFVEMRAPLVGAATGDDALNALALTVAARYDYYSDFGGTLNPKAGLEWYPVSGILIRGSYGKGFRPPSLYQLYAPPQSFSSIPAQDPRRGNELVAITQTIGGNPGLQAERSRSWTAGFVISELALRMRLEATFWRITQKERVMNLDQRTVLNHEDFFSERIMRGTPTTADISAGLPGRLISVDSSNVNFGELTTSGVDTQISSSFDTIFGHFAPSLAATWVAKFSEVTAPSLPSVNRVGRADVNGTIPRWRATATIPWVNGGLGLAASARYIAGYEDTIFNITNGRQVSSQTLIDFQGSLELGAMSAATWAQRLTVRAGVNNLFDREPPFSESVGLGFDMTQADVRQRFIYAVLSKAF